MSPQAGWILQEEVVPRLKSSIPRNVSCVGAEDAEELVQDATAIAAKMLHNVELAGRQVTPGSIAYYSLQLVKSGRRSTGSSIASSPLFHSIEHRLVRAFGNAQRLRGKVRPLQHRPVLVGFEGGRQIGQRCVCRQIVPQQRHRRLETVASDTATRALPIPMTKTRYTGTSFFSAR